MDISIVSPDEWIVLIVAALVSLTLLGSWYAALGSVTPLATPKGYRGPLYLLPLIAIIFLYFILQFFADTSVRTNFIYVLLYLLLGIAWLRLSLSVFPYLGLSVRDDLVERSNRAAAIAVGGALIGIVLCYAGANIGQGPSWIVVVISGLLSTIGFFVLWLLLNVTVNITDTVTIDRDDATALRLGAFFIGAGIILGRAVAGDWVSLEATIADFIRFGWPVLILLVIAIIGEILFRPTKERPIGSINLQGIMPGVAYIAIAVIMVLLFTPPLLIAQIPR